MNINVAFSLRTEHRLRLSEDNGTKRNFGLMKEKAKGNL